jgi:hypothetical protein
MYAKKRQYAMPWMRRSCHDLCTCQTLVLRFCLSCCTIPSGGICEVEELTPWVEVGGGVAMIGVKGKFEKKRHPLRGMSIEVARKW